MSITSSDIQNHIFSIDRKGYDVDEVDVFLERLATEIDEMNATIVHLEGEVDNTRIVNESISSTASFGGDTSDKDELIARLQRELEEKRANDTAISQALIIAQRSADDIKENANRDAEQIRHDAEDEAQRILDKANNEKKRILDEISELEENREETKSKYQETLKDFIDDASKKLSDLGGSAAIASTGTSMRATKSRPKGKTAAKTNSSPQVATYTTPQTKASAMVVPPTPKPSRADKDLSGFGDADDDFEFGDID